MMLDENSSAFSSIPSWAVIMLGILIYRAFRNSRYKVTGFTVSISSGTLACPGSLRKRFSALESTA
jgi:hypothetical protein